MLVIPFRHSIPLLTGQRTVPAPVATPAYDLSALVQCTMALAEARGEVRKLQRFFAAMSTTGQNITNEYVRHLWSSCNAIIQRGETATISELERAVRSPHLTSLGDSSLTVIL